MRIGIILRDGLNLSGWEKRIIDAIIESGTLEISLIILDKRNDANDANGYSQIIASKILRAQRWIEKVIGNTSTSEKNTYFLPSALENVVNIQINSSIAKEALVTKLRKFDLDLIINTGINQGDQAIGENARYGMWTLAIGRTPPRDILLAGFGEILRKAPYVEARLIQFHHSKITLIDKSLHFNHWSLLKSNQYLTASSSTLLIKNLFKLSTDKMSQGDRVISDLHQVDPGISDSVKYLINYYRNITIKAINRLKEKYLGLSQRPWSLYWGEGKFSTVNSSEIKKIQSPGGAFWADPFLFKRQGDQYIFFEDFPYRTQRGKISCARLIDGELFDVQNILEKDYHLSYPFIFEEDGEIFMMPETSENRRLELYQCVEFPHKWKLYATAFEGEALADATYFRDQAGQRWLFVNKGFGGHFDTELYIYALDSLGFKTITAHKENPVLIDASRARNAGPIFWQGDELLRPSQNNSFGIYGYGLNLNKIEKLTIEEYSESRIKMIGPDEMPGFISLHHLHQDGGKFIFDGVPS